MEKVEVIKIGDEQIIRLPKDFNLPDKDLFISREGNVVTLMTREEVWKIMDNALNGFTEDFFPNGREPQSMI
ncbi:MAG: AbrB/MazE/SpoVT family DNA-binding domain-containing protein [Selenomonadaceae bacterium]|nr:AbrB/MazE/SpoVT family DNA-binding domain-containing protein [Selenomonadaceae bacterium]